MKKVFISCPMNGLSEEYIKARLEELQGKLQSNMPIKVEFLDTLIEEELDSPVEYLGRSIELLGKAEVALFATGYENARGCVVEHAVAEAYGINIIYEEDLQ